MSRLLRPHEPRGPAARAWPAVGAMTCVCGWLARACQPWGRGLAGAAPLVAGLGGVHAADPGEAAGRVLMAPGGCPACLTVSGWGVLSWSWGGSPPCLLRRSTLPKVPAQQGWAGGFGVPSLGGEPLLESTLDLPSARPRGPGFQTLRPCWCLWGPPPCRPHAPPVPLSVEHPL